MVLPYMAEIKNCGVFIKERPHLNNGKTNGLISGGFKTYPITIAWFRDSTLFPEETESKSVFLKGFFRFRRKSSEILRKSWDVVAVLSCFDGQMPIFFPHTGSSLGT